ncbi:hypothetical protein BGZ83_008454 [Gryganskiella cystojenkinii]|nr:hypothetical protein BGZ83_008454 [Gryganskiella cystojenkinii]
MTTPTTTLWHPVPGRLQSVAVADKNTIWGVTLDQQLCKFSQTTQQWQLVSITTESVNQSRFSSSSVASGLSTSSTASSLLNTKRIASFIPSLGITSSNPKSPNPKSPNPTSFNTTPSTTTPTTLESSVLIDPECESTEMVSAASDGTVVRLDGSFKAWYLIAPHNPNVDFERDCIWIDLGHFWKCVSVASISQIWGLSDCGDLYYGTSDRFVQLDSSVTSGAGYEAPKFTQIAVGQDNTVLATDSSTGRVFRLKTHPTASHPPVWSALPGTGPGTTSGGGGLHMVRCWLSMADYIVGLAKDGHAYRFRTHDWICLGGGAKIESLGVGVDGYVLGVDRDGDLFGCQLESLNVPRPAIPRRVSSRGFKLSRNKNSGSDKDSNSEPHTPSSPQAPNGFPGLPSTPRQQAISKRPMPSPRELFEMAATTDKFNRTDSGRESFRDGTNTSSANGSTGVSSTVSTSPSSRSNSYRDRHKLDRSDSQLSNKRSYASDLASTLRYQGESYRSPVPGGSPRISATDASAIPTFADVTPLRIQTKPNLDNGGESYFAARAITTVGKSGDASPETSFPMGGNPYSTDSKPPSSSHTPQSSATSGQVASIPSAESLLYLSASSTSSSSSLASTTATPVSSSLQNSQHQKQQQQQQDVGVDGDKSEIKGSDEDPVDSMKFLSARRIHERDLAKKGDQGVTNLNGRNTVGDSGSGSGMMNVDKEEIRSYPDSQGVETLPSHDHIRATSPTTGESRLIVNMSGVASGLEGYYGDKQELDQQQPPSFTDSNRSSLEQYKKDWVSAQAAYGNVNTPTSNLQHNYSTDYNSSVPSLSDPRTSYSTTDDHSLDPPQQPWLSQQSLQQQQQHSGGGDFNQFQQTPGLLSHRSSDSSEILLLQQQEFLRLTRLRSQPASTDNLDLKQEVLISDKVPEISNNTNQIFQQQQKPAMQQPPVITNDDYKDKEERATRNPGRSSLPDSSSFNDSVMEGSNYSRSSIQLNKYVHREGVDGSVQRPVRNVYNANSPKLRPRNGIQGEDEQGRWTSTRTSVDERVIQFDPDNKNKKNPPVPNGYKDVTQ